MFEFNLMNISWRWGQWWIGVCNVELELFEGYLFYIDSRWHFDLLYMRYWWLRYQER